MIPLIIHMDIDSTNSFSANSPIMLLLNSCILHYAWSSLYAHKYNLSSMLPYSKKVLRGEIVVNGLKLRLSKKIFGEFGEFRSARLWTMLAMPIIYCISLAMPSYKAIPEHVVQLNMPEPRYEVETVVCGFHVYMRIRDTAIGGTLVCEQEGKKIHYPYSVAVVKEGIIVGHVWCAISSMCFHFLEKNGKITCFVTGKKQCSIDIPTHSEKTCPFITSNTNQQ